MRRARLAVLLVLAGCAPRADRAPADFANAAAARRQVWEALQPLAARRGLDPAFLYALVAAESGFDPRARRGEARGLLQIKPGAWQAVSRLPYEGGVWDWRSNLAVGADGLAATKAYLEARGVFSYPLLWAAHHYGLAYVEARGFDMGRVERPANRTAARLWAGDIHPLEPPR